MQLNSAKGRDESSRNLVYDGRRQTYEKQPVGLASTPEGGEESVFPFWDGRGGRICKFWLPDFRMWGAFYIFKNILLAFALQRPASFVYETGAKGELIFGMH